MNISTHKSSMLRPLEWLAALIGAINCILVPGLFAQQGRSFPLPFLYFLEIILLGVLVLLFVARRPQLDDRWHALPWAAAGVILAFVILGGFSIGFFLIPALIAFIVVGVLAARQADGAISRHMSQFLVAAVIQGAVMMLAVQIV